MASELGERLPGTSQTDAAEEAAGPQVGLGVAGTAAGTGRSGDPAVSEELCLGAVSFAAIESWRLCLGGFVTPSW